MSTAGKVLVVIVMLAILGWVILASLVTERNKNWGREMQRLSVEVDKLDVELAKLRSELDQRVADVSSRQRESNNELTVLRVRLNDVQKLETTTLESLTRAQFQVQSVQSAATSAQNDLDRRKAEEAETGKLLAAGRSKVDQLKEAVGAQLAELAKLRQSFKSLLSQNKEMLGRVERSIGPSRGGRVRSASLAR
jgi:chromosome segregation ATPase